MSVKKTVLPDWQVQESVTYRQVTRGLQTSRSKIQLHIFDTASAQGGEIDIKNFSRFCEHFVLLRKMHNWNHL